MKLVYIWLGEIAPRHVVLCWESVVPYLTSDDHVVIYVSKYRDDVPDQFEQIMIPENTEFPKINIATYCDYVRYHVLSTGNAGYSYVDSDVLFLRDPRSVLTSTPNKLKVIRETPSSICNAVIVTDNSNESINIISKAFEESSSLLSMGRKIPVTRLMKVYDSLCQRYSQDVEEIETSVLMPISYGAMVSRILHNDGKLKESDIKKIRNNPNCVAIHLWKPQSQPRTKMYQLDSMASDLLRMKDEEKW